MSSNHLYYITVATKPHRVLNKIQEHCAKNGETIHILGGQENRLIGWEGHQNFGVKLREVAEFLKKPELNNDDIILFTDAYDVVYCGTQKEILKRFLEFGKDIVFGCEKQCNPDPPRAKEYKIRDREFSYLNSGLFIGRVAALRKCILDYQYNDNDDDQRYWTTQFFNKPELITLDYNNSIFLNTVDIEMRYFVWDQSESIALYKDTNPLFVHVNGPDKSMVNELLTL